MTREEAVAIISKVLDDYSGGQIVGEAFAVLCDSELPPLIIMETEDREFESATLDTIRTREFGVPVYEYKEYYHSLESILRDEFSIEPSEEN